MRFTARTVEIFHRRERIAAHQRMSGNHKHTTVPEHMASSHRRYAGWTIERIRKEAATIGPATAALCNLILDERAHPEQGFRACPGIIRLARSYGQERLGAAALRAIDIGARTYGSVKSILTNNLDRRPSTKRSADNAPILHPNITRPTLDNSTRSAFMAWPKPLPTSKPAAMLQASAMPNGLRSCPNAKRGCDATSGSPRGCNTPRCVSRPASRTSTIDHFKSIQRTDRVAVHTYSSQPSAQPAARRLPSEAYEKEALRFRSSRV
ncbi:hypothetical protein AB7M49_005847 [Bradyrhizobium elkanii]